MKHFLFLIAACLLAPLLSAQITYWDGTASTDWTGSATASDPYRITTARQLAGLAQQVNDSVTYEGQFFRLEADIHLTDTTVDKELRHEWTPIGELRMTEVGNLAYVHDSLWFRGTFDGNGHTIHCLYTGSIDGWNGWTDPDDPLFEGTITPSTWRKSLFGFVGEEAAIYDLHLRDVRLIGSADMAALALYNHGDIHDCTAEGIVGNYGDVGGCAGGLVAANYGTIARCSTYLYVHGARGVGALVGTNYAHATIRDCYAQGTTYCTQYDGGGFIGTNLEDGLIEDCAADVEVKRGYYNYGSSDDMGGFVARNDGIVRRCRASGNVQGVYRHGAGGFVGTNTGRIEDCYATGDVYLADMVYGGAFVGTNGIYQFYNGWSSYDSGTIINCFATGRTINIDKVTESTPYPPAASGFCHGNELYTTSFSPLINCYYISDHGIDANNVNAYTGGSFIVDSAFLYTQAFVDTLNMVAAFCGTSSWQYRPDGYPMPTGEPIVDLSPYIGGGTGTADDPYRVATKEHLTTLATITNKGYPFDSIYFLQTADITLNAPQSEWGEQMPTNWQAIGDKAPFYQYLFCGRYDGGFHRICNLYMDNYSKDDQGLFGQLGTGAQIRCLGVVDAWIRTDNCPGILAGGGYRYAYDIAIESCYTTGRIESRTWMAGGLLGHVPLEGTTHVRNCYTTATVIGSNGALAIAGDQNYIGGETYSNDTVANCYAAGKYSNRYNGNLYRPLGQELNRNLFFDYQAAGYTSSTDSLYAKTTAYMQSKDFVNRLNHYVARYNSYTPDAPLCYWDWQENGYPVHAPTAPTMYTVRYESNGGTAVSAQPVLPGSHILPPTTPNQPQGTPYYTLPTRGEDIFIGWYTDAALTRAFDYNGVITSDTTLYAKWDTPYGDYDISLFKNEFATTYRIRTVAQLRGLAVATVGAEGIIDAMNFTGKTVILENDLFLNDTTDWQLWGETAFAREWTPIGKNSSFNFNGTFDGQGHTIYGLYCYATNTDNNYYGLFAYIGRQGRVENLHLRNAKVRPIYHACRGGGLLAGASEGKVIRCSAIGELTMNTTAGGLIGVAEYDSIVECYTIAKVRSIAQYGDVGGLVGSGKYSKLVDCYSLSEVNGRYMGGLISYGNGNSTINRCYAVSNVSIGQLNTATFTASYYDKAYADLLGNTDAQGKLTQQLMDRSTYQGWDFENVWGRKDSINGGYPYLRSQYSEYIPDDPDHVIIPVTGVTIETARTEILVGESVQLVATVQPENATYKEVTWSSNYPYDISVDANGVATALRQGSATITATTADGQKKATCVIRAVAPSIRVATASAPATQIYGLTLLRGEQTQLVASVVPDSLPQPAFLWSSENTEIATVENGLITGLAVGSTYFNITSADGSLTSRLSIRVQWYDVRGVSIKGATSIGVGESLTLQPVFTPTNASDQRVRWTTSDPTILTIDDAGTMTGVAPGEATIIVTTEDGGYTATHTVTVKSIPVTRVRITSSVSTMKVGERVRFEAEVYPSNAGNQEIIWSTSNESVLTVDQDGWVTAHAESSRRVSVYATSADNPDASAEARLRVSGTVAQMTDFRLSAETLTLHEGETYTLTPIIEPEEAAPYVQIAWESSNPSVVEVADGLLSARAVGEADIQALASSLDMTFVATCRVIVEANPETSLPNTSADPQPRKIIRDGQVLILRQGTIYNTTGQRVE